MRSKVQQELGSGKGGLLLDIYQENLSEPYMWQEWGKVLSYFLAPVWASSLGLGPRGSVHITWAACRRVLSVTRDGIKEGLLCMQSHSTSVSPRPAQDELVPQPRTTVLKQGSHRVLLPIVVPGSHGMCPLPMYKACRTYVLHDHS